ncbi:hypothetical protein CJ030_MR6G005863 [Morella rubra]|uniref:RNase H type-1 domain-containing protein n=1 Tax=Morella rubra TaxID=262757 RepID=A0A6A1V7G0_9ROSI|nr:hypothetical protein CJ030_MR6G005863 [Morella rubra]
MDSLSFLSPAALITAILQADSVFNIAVGSLKAFILNAAIVMDCLWFTRNKIIHEDAQVDTRVLISLIRRQYFEHADAWLVKGQDARLCWCPPCDGRLKFNSDVVIRSNGSYIAISVRDSLSSLCMVYTERFAAIDPLVGEALAMVEAMELARRNNWLCVDFECDSLILCKEVLSAERTSCWAIEASVAQIRRDLVEFREWKIAWVSQKCNRLAHLIAKWVARSNSVGFIFVSCIPEHIRDCDMLTPFSFQ